MSMSIYDEKVWLAQYPDPNKASLQIEFDSALEMFEATVARDPETDIIRYYDGRISARELDELSDAFAVGIRDHGFQPGERVVIFAQNIPQFVIAQVGTWKAGGIAVSANPMYKHRELAEILKDSGATVLVAMQDLYQNVAREVVTDTLGVVVNLQSGAATTGDELEILSRNCQLAPGDRAFMQRHRQVDVVAPEIRAEHKRNNTRPPADPERLKREQAEAMRILEATTPEM